MYEKKGEISACRSFSAAPPRSLPRVAAGPVRVAALEELDAAQHVPERHAAGGARVGGVAAARPQPRRHLHRTEQHVPGQAALLPVRDDGHAPLRHHHAPQVLRAAESRLRRRPQLSVVRRRRDPAALRTAERLVHQSHRAAAPPQRENAPRPLPQHEPRRLR
jgi:hypothetical protein